MVAIPLGRSTSKRNLLPDIRHRNMYVESTATDLTDGVILRERPDLRLFATIGTGPIRGVFRQSGSFGGDFLVVSGTQLWRVNGLGVGVLVGTVPTLNPPRIAIGKSAGADLALIADVGPLLQTDGVTVTSMAFPLGDVADVNYINGYFLGVPVGSSRWYYTDLTTGQFDATRFLNAERSADSTRRLEVTSDEIWAFGDASVEIFVPTGVDTPDQPPFQRVQGRVYDRGVLTPFGIQKLDNTVFFVGDDAKAYKGADVPVELPNQQGVADRLALADNIGSMAFTWRGHKFWLLNLGAQGTIAYDAVTGEWSEWSSFYTDGPVSRFRGYCAVAANTFVLVGDEQNANLYMLAEAFAADGLSDPLIRTFTGAIAVEGRPLCSSVSLMASGGLAPAGLNPRISLRVSDDQGKTWLNCGFRSLGRQGEYLIRPRWTRLGQMRPPMRIFEWTLSDAAQIRVSDAQMNTSA